MKQVANSLLQLATLRGYTPVKREINVQRLFDDIRQTMYGPLSEKRVILTTNASITSIWWQEDLIKSLILNLCYNALKACPDVGGVIRLEAHENVLSVADNGCGIAPEDLPKLTEPFFRIDKARSRGHGGVGLGLTLVKQIAQAHGADISIKSVVGAGTIVRVTFTSS